MKQRPLFSPQKPSSRRSYPFFFPHTGLQAGLDSTLALKFERHPKEDPPSPQKTNCPAPAAFHLVSGLLLVAVTHFGRDLSPSPSGLQAPFHTIRASVPVANEGRKKGDKRIPLGQQRGDEKKKKSPLPPSLHTPPLKCLVREAKRRPSGQKRWLFLGSRAQKSRKREGRRVKKEG